MLTNYQGPDAPLIDPDLQAQINNWRQQQLLQQLSGQKEDVPVAHNLGEGIAALGKGFTNALAGYQARQQAANQAAISTRLGAALNGIGGTGSAPTPFAGAGYQAPVGSSLQSATPAGLDKQALGDVTPVQQQVASALAAQGLNPTAIAGIMGNIAQESNFNPTVSGDHGASVGLFQHLGDRKAGLLKAVPDLNPAGQVNYAISELGGPNAPSLSIENLNAAKSPSEAADLFVNGFERPNPKYANYAGREKNAERFADQFGVAPPVSNTPQPPVRPTDFKVPAGQVAGPGVPSNLAVPGKLPGLQNAAVKVPINTPAPSEAQSDEEDNTSTPGSISPDMVGAPPLRFQPTTPLGGPGHYLPPGTPPAAAGTSLPPAAVTSVAAPAAPPVNPAQVQAPPPQPPPVPTQAGGGPNAAPPGTHWAQLPGPPLLLADNQNAATAGGASPLAQALNGGVGGGGSPTAQPQSLATGLAGGPVSQAAPAAQQLPVRQSSAAAPVAANVPMAAPKTSGDPYVDSLQQQHGAATAGLQDTTAKIQQLNRLGQLAAGTPYAAPIQAQAQELERQATHYQARIDKANDEFNAHMLEQQNRDTYRPLTDAEAAAAGISDKSGYQRDTKTNKIEQITGTGTTDTPAIKEYEYGEKHPGFSHAPKWVPNASVNDLGQPVPGWVSPPNPANQKETKDSTSELTDEQKKLVGEPNTYQMPNVSGGQLQAPTLQLTDDQHAALNSIPEARRGMVQDILERNMVAPPISSRNPLPTMLRNDVLKVMPNFDFASQPGQVKAKAEFLSGGPSSYSKQIEFGDTAINHLGDLTGLSDNVDKQAGYGEGKLADIIGGPTAQQLGTKFAEKTTAGQGAINAMQNKAATFSGELTKYLTGAEGSEAERKARAAALDPSLTPYARKLAVLDLVNTIDGRKSEIQAAWHNAVGPNVQDFPVLSQKAQANLDKIRAWATRPPGSVEGTTPEQSGPAISGKAPTTAQPQASAPPAFNYDAIPKGQIYTGPDGKQRRKQ